MTNPFHLAPPKDLFERWPAGLHRMIDADYVILIRHWGVPDELMAAADAVRAEHGLRVGLAAVVPFGPVDAQLGHMLMGAKAVAVVEEAAGGPWSEDVRAALAAIAPSLPRLYRVQRTGGGPRPSEAIPLLVAQLRNVVLCMAEAGPELIRLEGGSRTAFQ